MISTVRTKARTLADFLVAQASLLLLFFSRRPHFSGWVCAALVSFSQPWGLTAADTKHDLVANPAHFLSAALHPWTDIFPMGQLQNQAYGYLFPQGAFFLLASPLPDWVAQRLWWTLLLGLAFSGFLLLTRRIGVGSSGSRVLAAALYALSPRILTTLTAISSEAWPVALAPWVLWPLIPVAGAAHNNADRRLPVQGLSGVAASLLAVIGMGAVNATATVAACVPAALLLLWLRRWRFFAVWSVGCVAVSLWWLVPLAILGAYSTPFTDFIENSFVTTRWLNAAEVLRGTTSWTPFVETEREAGHALATSPYFVVVTLAIAALGLIGVCRPHLRLHKFWMLLLFVGVIIMCGAHLIPELLDGPGAALRNVHKFDPLLRLPLCIGLSHAVHIRFTRGVPQQRTASYALVVLVAAAAVSPAWSGRLLPSGAYSQVPSYWSEAADFLNEKASGTRTLILPAASFARQKWGWTRDEPLQPLLSVPWLARDAVPLVPPEAIRTLDGTLAAIDKGALNELPAQLERLGVGALVLRHDLDDSVVGTTGTALTLNKAQQIFPHAEVRTFGKVDVMVFAPQRNMLLADAEKAAPTPTKIAGGGEILPLLPRGLYELTNKDAEIVTDTPMLTARNFGTIQSAVSAPLVSADEAPDVRRTVLDYPSQGLYTRVVETGGSVTASSSAADATAFGGAHPERSLTAAVDGDPDTAWFPAPGTQEGQWLELQAHSDNPTLSLTTTGAPAALTISSAGAHTKVKIKPGIPTTIKVPGGPTDAVRITLGPQQPTTTGSGKVGIAEAAIKDAPIRRVVTVPEAPMSVREFLFQKVTVDTGVIIRSFSLPKDLTVQLSQSDCNQPTYIDGTPHTCGNDIQLTAGHHEVRTRSNWIRLTEPGFSPEIGLRDLTRGEVIPAADHDRILVTTRAANKGLRATLEDGTELRPVEFNAASQSFIVPAGAHGAVTLSMSADTTYRRGLLGGGALAIAIALGCGIAISRRRRTIEAPVKTWPAPILPIIGTAATCCVLGGWGLLILPSLWAIRRFTTITPTVIVAAMMAITALWLARSPWPSAHYFDLVPFTDVLCCLALLCPLFAKEKPQDAP
ncbi:Arabinofuranosyltransferase [Corynebacterium pseudotuberculosis]|uniref:alpha-(1->3)-arabinofuranosyltransferase domain-containing protein n=1 Tax=Corynebacterium pseudotuberculosis TaxID=1719 RepID=UPI000671C8B5|nr:alpha-(1->3)-arabinofuranosyltransferase family protein [Corynebacterium pseudotuberculosis]AKP09531.1 Arabinofuranosyltransferase [Corynebacterium pseudotuberculosis]